MTAAFVVRDARPDDAPALAALYRRSVEVLGARAYAPDQVAAWASRAPSAAALKEKMTDGRTRLVAAGPDGAPAAFADLTREGCVDFFYAAPEAAGTGAAAALCAELEARARALGLLRLTAHVSEAAKGFFTRQGWTAGKRRDLAIDGVAIHNWEMAKELA